jgi:hypothetical protein
MYSCPSEMFTDGFIPTCIILQGAFIVKGAKDYVYTHKILHPHDFEK